VRDARKLFSQHREINEDRLVPIIGDLRDRSALRQAAGVSQAAIHLVGIIIARPLRGQTFHRVHFEGTRNVLNAVAEAGIRRYVHMSALGTRPNAVSKYHQTKWQAEELVRASGLDWTIFRPSLIHGSDGEFMQLMRRFMCGLVPPVIPYFGSGDAKLQPVYVGDVARCFVDALAKPESTGQVIPLGGPRAYSWRELYHICRTLMPCSKSWKPMVSQPVPVANAAAVLSAPLLGLAEAVFPSLGLLRFDRGQVAMSQEDSVCDHTLAERAFGLRMRSFEEELATYADRIPG
jgi:NADH dehydrogenase